MILYHIDKENRTVTARFKDGAYAVSASISDKMTAIERSSLFIGIGTVIRTFKDHGKFNMIGMAKCHADDEWDEEIGKNLAKRRLLRKFCVTQHEVLLEIKKRFISESKQVLNTISSMERKYKENTIKHKKG